MLHRFGNFTRHHKIVRGMISYAMLWPSGCLVEQTLLEKRSLQDYDWIRCLKFSLFGGLFMGPTFYLWIRLAGAGWPRTDIKSSLCKAIAEQLAYDPMAITSFLFFMSLMDGHTLSQASREVSNKFFDAYKVGIIYWPCVQTVNFKFVPLRNQVIVTSFFSTLWTAFLTYLKYLDIQHDDDDDDSIDDDDRELIQRATT